MQYTGINTRALALGAAGVLPFGDGLLGSITLPAGGPWEILYAWVQAVPQTATAAEAIGGNLKLVAASGDVSPSMSPLKIPSGYCPSFLGSVTGPIHVPLQLFPVDMQAAGKAVIEFYFDNHMTVTVAPIVTAGIIIGQDRHTPETPIWYDEINATVNLATKTNLGTITLSESASKIVGITGCIATQGVVVTAEELLGIFILESDDLKIQPMQLPFSSAWGAGLSTPIAPLVQTTPVWIPLDIPVPAGARIDVSVDLVTAITNLARAGVTIGYR